MADRVMMFVVVFCLDFLNCENEKEKKKNGKNIFVHEKIVIASQIM